MQVQYIGIYSKIVILFFTKTHVLTCTILQDRKKKSKLVFLIKLFDITKSNNAKLNKQFIRNY